MSLRSFEVLVTRTRRITETQTVVVDAHNETGAADRALDEANDLNEWEEVDSDPIFDEAEAEVIGEPV